MIMASLQHDLIEILGMVMITANVITLNKKIAPIITLRIKLAGSKEDTNSG
jgi:hypothetical protein